MDQTRRFGSDDHSDAKRLYLDFDSFFATAEQHFNPDLRGKPVGVVPLDSPHTGCIAISREAKALGLKTNISIAEARQAVPGMIFVVARPDAYVRLHHRILAVIGTCLPVAKVRSIDELVCHLLAFETEQPAALAQKVKDALAKHFSAVLTCSIGIASTELLAKIGAEMNKPDGFVLLRGSELPGRLNHLALRKIPGISTGIEARLHAAGIFDFSALWSLGPKHLRALWGNIEGERFWNSLHGEPVERPPTVKRMFGHSRMLPQDWRTPEKVHQCARQLLLSASRRLRRANLKASKMTIGLRGGRDSSMRRRNKMTRHWNCEIAFPPARDDITLLKTLAEAMRDCDQELRSRPELVSITLHGLVPEEEIQRDLFSDAGSGSSQDKAKWERLSDTLDRLRTTHGPAAISLGPKMDMPGGYVGAKIAFGRIPELADFSEAQTEDGATHFCSL
ncbi:Y-family DNA polymerase [Qipengyuania marisflavi]|uniref:DNA-directed DNA polymerase n=1 Tax=Qipengyuania marisflavi TaxID=2486356 RepID=A0A5S3P2R8_9SPHN|nr:type VI secretion protein ImpB [Qipengyuania marisflavi]TMM47272.1 type VI secretion protein ImpB [Qipengyuania marisflavi]